MKKWFWVLCDYTTHMKLKGKFCRMRALGCWAVRKQIKKWL